MLQFIRLVNNSSGSGSAVQLAYTISRDHAEHPYRLFQSPKPVSVLHNVAFDKVLTCLKSRVNYRNGDVSRLSLETQKHLVVNHSTSPADALASLCDAAVDMCDNAEAIAV